MPPSHDRVVLVTGGTGNLGSAICRRAAAEGWRVAFVYRSNQEKAEALAQQIRGYALQADITDERAVDVLSGNAGFSGVAVTVAPLPRG